MPPKIKISRDELLESAFKLAREEGIENFNARNIANRLGCSTQIIFSYYKNMADLKDEIFCMANRYHSEYLNNANIDENLFLNIGLIYIDFALNEPNLFRLLFMSNGFEGKNLNDFVTNGCNENISKAILNMINITNPVSYKIFTDMWLYAHGIASMVVTNQLKIDRDEIKEMVSSMFQLLVKRNI